ncbi:MAG: hypothetical protein ABL967_16960 [Bryobacteraceae bacterium]
MARKGNREQILKEAWTGDAVLSLYVRAKILREDGVIDGPKAARMTSNQFLSALGEPSEVEAELGRVYDRNGLDAAFVWIESRLLPTFDRQEAKRTRRLPSASAPHPRQIAGGKSAHS